MIRQVLAALTVCFAGLISLPAAATSREIFFTVERNGTPFGTHSLRFETTPQALTVSVAIDLKVDFGPITVFRYTHRNREVWTAGTGGLRLAALDTQTDDDGEKFRTAGVALGQGFRLSEGEATGVLAGDIVPTSYWHRASLERRAWLDTQSGRLRQVRVQPLGPESVTVAGQPVTANRYRVTGDLEMDLWYLPNGEWAGLEFSARGSLIRYRRQTPADVAVLPEGVKPAPALASAAP